MACGYFYLTPEPNMVSFQNQTPFTLMPKKQYKTWITHLIAQEGKRVGEINYLFCDDDYLLEINRKYLQHDTLTDIITFDYVEGDIISGDIAISVARVKENALKYGIGMKEELLRVMSHGIFHLLGYQDETEKEKGLMRKKEKEAIDLFVEKSKTQK